jgi:hypothetical protein
VTNDAHNDVQVQALHDEGGDQDSVVEAFAEFGNAPGTTAHYIRTDGTGGFVIGESEDFVALYRNILNYLEFVDFEQHMVMAVEDGVALITDYVSS